MTITTSDWASPDCLASAPPLPGGGGAPLLGSVDMTLSHSGSFAFPALLGSTVNHIPVPDGAVTWSLTFTTVSFSFAGLSIPAANAAWWILAKLPQVLPIVTGLDGQLSGFLRAGETHPPNVGGFWDGSEGGTPGPGDVSSSSGMNMLDSSNFPSPPSGPIDFTGTSRALADDALEGGDWQLALTDATAPAISATATTVDCVIVAHFTFYGATPPALSTSAFTDPACLTNASVTPGGGGLIAMTASGAANPITLTGGPEPDGAYGIAFSEPDDPGPGGLEPGYPKLVRYSQTGPVEGLKGEDYRLDGGAPGSGKGIWRVFRYGTPFVVDTDLIYVTPHWFGSLLGVFNAARHQTDITNYFDGMYSNYGPPCFGWESAGFGSPPNYAFPLFEDDSKVLSVNAGLVDTTSHLLFTLATYQLSGVSGLLLTDGIDPFTVSAEFQGFPGIPFTDSPTATVTSGLNLGWVGSDWPTPSPYAWDIDYPASYALSDGPSGLLVPLPYPVVVVSGHEYTPWMAVGTGADCVKLGATYDATFSLALGGGIRTSAYCA